MRLLSPAADEAKPQHQQHQRNRVQTRVQGRQIAGFHSTTPPAPRPGPLLESARFPLAPRPPPPPAIAPAHPPPPSACCVEISRPGPPAPPPTSPPAPVSIASSPDYEFRPAYPSRTAT